MKVVDFLNSLLSFNACTTHDVDQKYEILEHQKRRIYKEITRESRLSLRPSPEFRSLLEDKIHNTIQNGETLKVVIGFGGFKNPYSSSFPHIDWSEVFAVRSILETCCRIASFYSPGVWVEYSGDSYALQFFDNIPKKDIDVYVKEFDCLVALFQQNLPDNVKITCKHMNEFYNLDELYARMREWVDELKKNNPEKAKEMILGFTSKAKNNIKIDGIEDYTDLPSEEMEEIVRESVLLDRAWINIDIDERSEYLEGGNVIPVVNTSIEGCLSIKSFGPTKLAFWLGTGYILKAGKLIPTSVHGTKEDAELGSAEDLEVDTVFKRVSPTLARIRVKGASA